MEENCAQCPGTYIVVSGEHEREAFSSLVAVRAEFARVASFSPSFHQERRALRSSPNFLLSLLGRIAFITLPCTTG